MSAGPWWATNQSLTLGSLMPGVPLRVREDPVELGPDGRRGEVVDVGVPGAVEDAGEHEPRVVIEDRASCSVPISRSAGRSPPETPRCSLVSTWRSWSAWPGLIEVMTVNSAHTPSVMPGRSG